MNYKNKRCFSTSYFFASGAMIYFICRFHAHPPLPHALCGAYYPPSRMARATLSPTLSRNRPAHLRMGQDLPPAYTGQELPRLAGRPSCRDTRIVMYAFISSRLLAGRPSCRDTRFVMYTSISVLVSLPKAAATQGHNRFYKFIIAICVP